MTAATGKAILPLPEVACPPLSDPAVSIVICNYNHGRYLAQAIDSALSQRPACQVVVVDDGSTDESRDLLSKVDARVDVVLQPNAGQLAACNTGFERCTGDVVVFLDADDALEPGAVARFASLFGAGIAKVHARMALVDEHDRLLGGHVPSTLMTGDVLEPLRRHGLLYPSPPGSGNAYRRTVLDRLFPLPVDAADRVAADFFLIYGAVAFGAVAASDEVLVRYRLHRKPTEAADELVFGNAALGNDEAAKVATRYGRLRRWLIQRSGGAVDIAPEFLDFSVQKTSYAQSVLARPYGAALFGSGPMLSRLVKSIWLQPGYGVKKKVGLTAWAGLVLLSPRQTGFKLARYVCNPASRAP